MEREIINPRAVARPLGLYSHGARAKAGHYLFIAGQLAVDESGQVVGKGDFAAQMRQVFMNMERVLASAGAGFSNVVKFTTYLVRPQDIETFMQVRRELFARLYAEGDYPPNTLLVIDRLVREEFLIEVEAVAALP